MRTFEEYLSLLLKKDINELNSGELAFIMARRDYLTEEQKQKYQLVVENIPNTKVQYGRPHKTNTRRA